MALSSEVFSRSYTGNNSTSTPYVVDFRVDDASHILVSTHAGTDPAVLLDPSEYTVTAVSGGWEVRTDVAVPGTSTVTVYRWVPLTQLLELPTSGAVNLQTLERQGLDRIMMAVQQLRGLIDGGGIVAGTGSAVLGVQVVADATARAAAVPAFVGQVLIQRSPASSVWIAGSTAAGDWTEFMGQRVFANQAALEAESPDFAGQLAVVSDMGTVWCGRGAGWVLAWGRNPDVWNAMAFRQDEQITASSTRRFVGTIPRQFIVERACLFVAQPGIGTLTATLHLPNSGRTVTIPNFELAGVPYAMLEASDIADTVAGTWDSVGNVWTGGISENAAAGAFSMERVEVEIMSVGENTPGATLTAGSNVSTPGGGAFDLFLTGQQVSITGQADAVLVVGSAIGGTARLSHAANQTGTVTVLSSPRLYTVGLTGLALSAGATVVTVSAQEAAMITVGQEVRGATIPPGTVVQTVTPGGPSITLSKPVTGATAQLAIVDSVLPAIQRHTGLTALIGATTITVPHVRGLTVGDAVTGANVPADTYVSAIPGTTSVTISAAITGGISELWFGPPKRPATAAAGATTVPLTHTTGIKIGQLVSSGAGVSPETYVTGVSSPNVSFSKPLSQAVTAESFTFTADRMQVTGSITVGATDIILPYAVSATPIAIGDLVTGNGIPPGTFVTAMAGSQIVVNNEAQSTDAAATLVFQPNPQWLGLEVALVGHWISPTPPR